jgi:predicted Zn-dependent protease
MSLHLDRPRHARGACRVRRSHTRAPLLLLAVLLGLAAACAISPTGRRQLMLFSEDQMAQMGIQSFDAIKQEQTISTDPAVNAYVGCVTDALRRVVDVRWQDDWEVVVFQDPTANAFALPGRKIGVHTGLLKIARTQGQLAAVIGHEIGHVLAGHGNERVSQQAAAQASMQAASIFVDPSTASGQATMAALGIGAEYGVLLPFSRTHESEADAIGLDLMSRAGFDPSEAVRLWENMRAAGGQQPPEWTSTHPSHDTRIEDLRAALPEAETKRDAARAAGLVPRCTPP